VNAGPLPAHTVAGLLAAYGSGALTPLSAIDAAFARITVDDPALNAMTTLCEERARTEALASGERYRLGTNRALEGVPFAVKDLIDCADLETTYGSRLYERHVPAVDAGAVARLRQAGAILVGKTATHEFGWGITTTSALHGPTRNPWDPRRIPGGSSGGSAAAIAAGFVPFALGTDTAGSIRIPSAFCGIAGLKPSRDRVPLDGVFPLANSLDHVGPMAGNAEDLRLVLSALDGQLTPDTDAPALSAIKFGILPTLFPHRLAPDIQTVFSRFLLQITAAGADIATLAWPAAAPRDPFAVLAPILNAEARHLHAEQLGHFPDRVADYSPDVAARIAFAERYGFAEYIAASQQRVHFTSAFASLFAQVDAVLSPVSSVTPPEISVETVLVEGKNIDLREAVMGHIAPQSLSGLPVCVIKIGRDTSGLPVGAQITGRFGSDRDLLAIAARLECASSELAASE